MALLASAFVLGEFVMTLSRSRGQPLPAALAASAPRFVMAAILGAAIGYVLNVFGIKVTP
jgi:hypothetical protein